MDVNQLVSVVFSPTLLSWFLHKTFCVLVDNQHLKILLDEALPSERPIIVQEYERILPHSSPLLKRAA